MVVQCNREGLLRGNPLRVSAGCEKAQAQQTHNNICKCYCYKVVRQTSNNDINAMSGNGVPCADDLQHAPRCYRTVKVKVKVKVQVGTDRRRRWWWWTCCAALKGCTARHGEVLGDAWRCLEVLGDWVKVL